MNAKFSVLPCAGARQAKNQSGSQSETDAVLLVASPIWTSRIWPCVHAGVNISTKTQTHPPLDSQTLPPVKIEKSNLIWFFLNFLPKISHIFSTLSKDFCLCRYCKNKFQYFKSNNWEIFNNLHQISWVECLKLFSKMTNFQNCSPLI